VRGSSIEGRLRSASSATASWRPSRARKKRAFQFAGASRALTVSFTTLRAGHIVFLRPNGPDGRTKVAAIPRARDMDGS